MKIIINTIIILFIHYTQVQANEYDFNKYKIILERNIFDSTRGIDNNISIEQLIPTPTPEPDYIDVTGTIIQKNKAIAFFEGSKTNFNKAISTGNFIANAKLIKINNTQITLEFNNKQHIIIPIGDRIIIEYNGKINVIKKHNI